MRSRLRAIFAVVRHHSTIYALSTAPGRAGVAVVRVSGPKCQHVMSAMTCQRNWTPRMLAMVGIRSAVSGELLDRGMAVWFPGPRSYTGEDMCEFHIHGSLAVVRDVLEAIGGIEGTEQARPGEFTKRALLSDKMDVTEVEGLSDLLSAETSLQRRVALRLASGQLSKQLGDWRERLKKVSASLEALIDFSEDDGIDDGVLRQADYSLTKMMSEMGTVLQSSRNAERLRSGFSVVVAGEPNVGKSSLVNLLSEKPTSIVTPIPGTTRDVLDVSVDIAGYPVTLTDTAGLRESTDEVEVEGIKRAREKIHQADLVLLVTDATTPQLDREALLNDVKSMTDAPVLPILNKIDLVDSSFDPPLIPVSCETRIGMDLLSTALENELSKMYTPVPTPALTRSHQLVHLRRCIDHLRASISEQQLDLKAECVRLCLLEIGRITGHVGIEEVLDTLFSEFCVGK